MSLAELSLRRPVSAIMFYISLMVLGLIAAFKLPLEQFPALTAPFIYIELPYAGASPEEVERTIVRPAEEALATLSGVKNMWSNARGDGGGIFLEFDDWARDTNIAASEARDRIDAIRTDLPDDFQRYFVMKFSTTDEPVLRLRFTSDRDCSSGGSSASPAWPASTSSAWSRRRSRWRSTPCASGRTTSP
jgi:HAE1 family hydrophobic/amphiphilic exporter-1